MAAAIICAMLRATMPNLTIIIFTRRSAERTLAEGGSGDWVLDPRNARRHRYLVCTRNAKAAELGADEAHRAAFLVGTISDIVAVGEDRKGQMRWRIAIDSYASLTQPGRLESLAESGPLHDTRSGRNRCQETQVPAASIDKDRREADDRGSESGPRGVVRRYPGRDRDHDPRIVRLRRRVAPRPFALSRTH